MTGLVATALEDTTTNYVDSRYLQGLLASQLDTLRHRHSGAFAPVDLVLPDPVMDRDSTDAEFNGGSGDVLAGTD